MDATRLGTFVEQIWEDAAVPALTEYMRIPNKSPAFDPDWEAHGYMRDAVSLMEVWARDHLPKNATLEIVRLSGRTPLMFIESPGESSATVLLYGHLDKQP
ncbi:MAG: peptidase M20, partial [Rhizomicrobium sp.]